MKFAHKPLLAAVLLASLGLAASAQTPPPAPGAAPPAQEQHGGPRMGHGDPAKMKEMMAKHMAELKQKLQITPAQEDAWTNWTSAVQPPANRPPRPDRDAFAKMTTPERIDKMREMRGLHMAEMDKRADATKAFYATLSPEQQKTFDAAALRFMQRRHGGMRHHGG